MLREPGKHRRDPPLCKAPAQSYHHHLPETSGGDWGSKEKYLGLKAKKSDLWPSMFYLFMGLKPWTGKKIQLQHAVAGKTAPIAAPSNTPEWVKQPQLLLPVTPQRG